MRPESQLAFIHAILLGRLLFASDPEEIEARIPNDAEERLAARGRGAIRDSSGNSIEFIVLHNGTRYTTKTRPAWLIDAEIEDIDSTGQRRLLAALTREIKLCRDHPAIAELEAMRTTVEDLYGHSDNASKIATATTSFCSILADDPEPLSVVLQSDDQARRWSERQVQRLLTAYTQIKLTGYRLDRLLATVWLWANSPLPLHDSLESGLPPGMSKENNFLQVGGRPVQFFPRLDPRYYLTMLTDKTSAVIWGSVTARARQREGDQLREKARTVGVRPHAFNGLLYRALLRYRVALRLYQEVLTLYDEKRIRRFIGTPYDKKLIERDAIACEENRVVILASMKHAADPKVGDQPDFFDVFQYGQWLDRLCRWSRTDLRSIVFGLETQLIISQKMRALAVATVDALTGRGVLALEEIADDMFNDLSASDALFEPDYLTFALQTIANILEAQGDVSRATSYRQRATDLPGRVALLVSEAKYSSS